MDRSILKDAGLTDGEIKVYLALIETGSSTTGPIVEKSGISRSIVYQILEKLMEKGLVSYIIKEKTKYFQAAEPSRILDYIDEREKHLQANRKKVVDILPLLEARAHSSPESEARLFEGFKGMITVHEHSYRKLKRGEEYFFLGIPPEQPKYYHAYWNRDHRRRVKAGIYVKLLFHPSTDKKILKNRNSYWGCDARYMPVNINTPSWFMGYKDVAVVGFPSKTPITLQITNQEIADSFKAYFNEFWRRSKPFTK